MSADRVALHAGRLRAWAQKAALALVVFVLLPCADISQARGSESQERDSRVGPLGVIALPPANAGEPSSPEPSRASALAIAALDRKLADLQSAQMQAKQELDSIGAQITHSHSRSVANGRVFYKLSRVGLLSVGGGVSDFLSHAARVERARRAVARDLETEARLRARGAVLTAAVDRFGQERAVAAQQRSEAIAARMAEDEEARRRSAFARAFESSAEAGEYVAVYGGTGLEGDRALGGFASARGRLLFPLVGRSESKASRREGMSGPGLEIHGTPGATVRAVFGGRVVFSDRYGPYGRLVIIDHGDHYFTVSGNLGTCDVKVGDVVATGDRVGSISDDASSAMLYFEVRRGTETLAPGPWLGSAAGR